MLHRHSDGSLVMRATERHCELIAQLATEGTRFAPSPSGEDPTAADRKSGSEESEHHRN
jgi:hypothetical protein